MYVSYVEGTPRVAARTAAIDLPRRIRELPLRMRMTTFYT